MGSWRLRHPSTRVGQWPLNGHADDVSGYAQDMTWFGSEAYVDGPFGRMVATFDGATDYLRYAVADWRAGDQQGMLSAWIYRNVTGAIHTIFSSQDEATNLRYLMMRINGDFLDIVQFNNAGHDRVRGSTTINAGQWYHVAFMSDGSQYKLFLDGVEETLVVLSGANTGDWLADTTLRDNITIGAAVGLGISSYFNGDISDVRYYSVPLTNDEILDIMHSERS